MDRKESADFISLARLLTQAENRIADYLQRTEGLSHEKKGIRRSEMFFLYASVADAQPARILESGRGRAQSTLVLSSLFPRASIVSVESDPNSPDVAIAAERLKNRSNVECRFGDSRLLVPQLLQIGDVVLIDGPKDFRALKLALRLLRTGKPSAVFVHDLWWGSPARRFVDHHMPRAFLSDNPAWVRRYSILDSRDRTPPASSQNLRWAYGATLGCLPLAGENYTMRLLQCNIAEAFERIRETGRKLCGRPARVRPKDFVCVGPAT